MFEVMKKQDIKDLANCKKMNSRSENILISKLEEKLTNTLLNIDTNNTKRLSFEQLGRVLCVMEVFNVIQYDENFAINTEEFFTEHRDKQTIRYSEMIFHEQFWAHLCHNNNENVDFYENEEGSETVNQEFTYAFLRILLDPRRLKLKEHYEFIRRFLMDGGYNVLLEGKIVVDKTDNGEAERVIWP